MDDSDQGLGLSVAVYALALLCGLAVVVLPVYWANAPAVYDNPGVSAARLPGGPIASHRADFPLAKLQSKPIVSEAMLAEFNAKSIKTKKAEKPVRRASNRPAPSHRNYAQAQRDYAQAQRDETPDYRPRRPFFFSLFGG
jgi:hypothetical protein